MKSIDLVKIDKANRVRSTQSKWEVLIYSDAQSALKYWSSTPLLLCLPSKAGTIKRRSSTPVLEQPTIVFPYQQLLHGHSRMYISTSPPNQQGYGNADSCNSVHQILAPGNSNDNSTPTSRPSYGKCRTRARVYPTCKAMWMQTRAKGFTTFTPENSHSSVVQSSLKREIEGQDMGISGLR